MTFLALLILGILWAVVLLPPLVQRVPAIASRSTKDAVSGFSDQLSRLERPIGAAVAPNHSPRQGESLLPDSTLAAARRRRDIAGSLCALALFTLVATTILGRPALIAHIVVDLVLLAFMFAIIRRNQVQSSHTAVVTQLPTRRSVNVPVAELGQYRKSG